MLDETKGNQQGTQTSTGESGSTSGETETFTKQTVEGLINKVRSDALAEFGRVRKSAEEAITKSTLAFAEQLSQSLEQHYETELETAKDDPDKIREIRQRQKETRNRIQSVTERRKEEVEKAGINERIKKAEAIEKRDLAREVATEFQVDYKTLEKFGTDRETMTELAKSLPKSGDAQGGQGDQSTRVKEPPEGGKTKGGGSGRVPTTEELKASTPFETDAKIKSGEWKVRGWTP